MHAFLTKRIEISWLKLIAYVIGIWMCVHGGLGFRADTELEKTWAVMKDELFHVLFMIWGILICGATWLRYRGGLWSVAGAYLVGGALYDSVLIVQAHIHGWHFDSPVQFYIRVALLLVVGIVLAVIGHLRHCRERQTMPNKTLEPTADGAVSSAIAAHAASRRWLSFFR
jgi:hypothetical protein